MFKESRKGNLSKRSRKEGKSINKRKTLVKRGVRGKLFHIS